MAKKENKRCPLQVSCERKCEYEGQELACDFYDVNGFGDFGIPDQEEIRQERYRKHQEEMDYAEIENLPDEEDTLQSDKGNMVWLPIDQLHPHPGNPRKELGDLTELADSIRRNGVFQNLTVVSAEDGYTVIIGHRRRAASELAGLTHLPCVIVEMSPMEQLQTMLLENMQRVDLTVYEQAQGFQLMMDMGDTVEGIAEKTGFSKATVKRRLKMAELDQSTLKEVSSRQISMDDFDRLAKIENIDKRNAVLKTIGTNNFNNEVQSAFRKQEISKKMPIAKKLVKKLKGNKISRSETYGREYTLLGNKIQLSTWDGVSHPVPEGDTRKLFYTLEEFYGELAFYVKTPKAKPQKRPQEEIDREKRMVDAHEQVKQMNELHYELRKAFVDSLKVGKHNQLAMLQAAVLTCAATSLCYSSHNRSMTLSLLGLEDRYMPDRGKQAVAGFDKVDPNDYPKLIYARLGDRKELSYSTSYKDSFPRHQECDELEVLYTWLAWLGYEMSDEEIALRNGTHEVFSLT